MATTTGAPAPMHSTPLALARGFLTGGVVGYRSPRSSWAGHRERGPVH
ncbi:hypothetical protein [Streptomyces sp. NPDC059819]